MNNKRKIYDISLQTITYLAASIGIISLFLILSFIFLKGYKLVNLNLITSDFYPQTESITINSNMEYENINKDQYFIKNYGFSLIKTKSTSGIEQIKITNILENSPLKNSQDVNKNKNIEIKNGMIINKIITSDYQIGLKNMTLDEIKNILESNNNIKELNLQTSGGGIRGSLITTLYLVLITPIIAFPLGIGAAIYLNEYAKKNKITNFIRQTIELLTGIPSIIYGLLGSAIFIPLTMKLLNATGGNIISGALTMSLMLLPIIIRSTEESLKVVPRSYKEASLALGANKTQTIFKIIIPASLPGIISGAVLSIGRIFGESAALIYAIGVITRDRVDLKSQSSTLAVQIWSIMGQETPNFELASAISLIVLGIVLILNISVKLIFRKYKEAV